MYKVRWIENGAATIRTATTRDDALRLSREVIALGMRAVIFERRGRKWGVIEDWAAA